VQLRSRTESWCGAWFISEGKRGSRCTLGRCPASHHSSQRFLALNLLEQCNRLGENNDPQNTAFGTPSATILPRTPINESTFPETVSRATQRRRKRNLTSRAHVLDVHLACIPVVMSSCGASRDEKVCIRACVRQAGLSVAEKVCGTGEFRAKGTPFGWGLVSQWYRVGDQVSGSLFSERLARFSDSL
jgi:hypothetical protein